METIIVQIKNKKALELLKNLEDLEIIKVLKKDEDWWNTISDEERSAIEKGLQDAENGKLKPHSEAKKILNAHFA
ncbi:hypothetical protein [Moheibacter lacus]|uniref:hypothetical protein n=1 Tax=Moheibacter lacus TaxID=2745851 RepID=UPI001C70EF00|nr:hypothetical protein [Moheibacter lacus]